MFFSIKKQGEKADQLKLQAGRFSLFQNIFNACVCKDVKERERESKAKQSNFNHSTLLIITSVY